LTDEHKLLRDADRASKVQALIENEYLVEAFQTLEKTYIETWRATDINDSVSREKLYMKVAALNDVIAHLGTILNDGKLASHQLKALAERPKRFGIL
jgi:hypothetical protein